MTIAGNILKKINEDIWNSKDYPVHAVNVDDPDSVNPSDNHTMYSRGLDFRARGPILAPPGKDIWNLEVTPMSPENVDEPNTANNGPDRGPMTQKGPEGALDVLESSYQIGLKIGMGDDLTAVNEDTSK